MADIVGLGKYQNSKKISELKVSDVMSYYQQDSWLPIAQRNPRTGSYTNLAVSVDNITAYAIETSYAYTAYLASYYANSSLHSTQAWLNLLAIEDSEDGSIDLEHATVINNSGIASKLVSYSFSYTMSKFSWQNCTSGDILTNTQLIDTNSNKIDDEIVKE